MKTSWKPARTAIAIALCATFAIGSARAQAPSAQPVPGASMTVLPGDDFFAYANADWLARTEIPADRSSWGAGAALAPARESPIT